MTGWVTVVWLIRVGIMLCQVAPPDAEYSFAHLSPSESVGLASKVASHADGQGQEW